MSGHITLILGGARSGKSACAERLAAESGRPVLFVATASAGDDEMAARIARHQAERPARWRTVEAPHAVAEAIVANANAGDAILLDCLTLWVANALEAGWSDDRVERSADGAAWLAAARPSPTVVVSNEVGLGLVPVEPLGRRFRDVLGRVNASFAGAADRACLVVAGRTLELG